MTLHAWGEAGDPIAIETGDIHLWLASYDAFGDADLQNAYRRIISGSEREQESRFYFDKDKRRYLMTRALVRCVLSRYAPLSPRAWTFGTNEYGRPEIANAGMRGRALSFNISHTDSLIVLGLTRGGYLGVDVENLSLRDAPIDIADRYFGRNEVSALASLPQAHQHRRFFEYWTFKESYIKARGMGLSLPLDGFQFAFPDERVVRIDIRSDLADDPARWRFWQFAPMPEYLVALCAERIDAARPPVISIYQAVPLHSERVLALDALRTSG